MSDEIIDITRYLERDPVQEALPRTIALWGVDGERSRFALWRVVHLAGADRGVILWRHASGDRAPQPFVVIDLARDPARLDRDAVRPGLCGPRRLPGLARRPHLVPARRGRRVAQDTARAQEARGRPLPGRRVRGPALLARLRRRR